MEKPTRTTIEDSGALWIEPQLSLFVCSELLVLSSSVAQFLAYMIDHTVAQVCALFVSLSSSFLMRTLSDSLRPLHLPHSLHLLYLPALPSAFHLLLP